jgi:integrase
VSYWHKLAGVTDPNQHFLVQKMLAGARKLKPQRDVRLPITPDILRLLIRAVDATSEAPYYNVMVKAMFLLAFHALLRVGEFTITNSSQQHTLQYDEVELQSRNSICSLVVTMNSFKHSHHAPTYLHIAAQAGPLCPVTAYQKYKSMRGISKGPLFIFPDKTPVTRSFFVSQLNTALLWAKLDPKLYKGHGFRLGAATTAAANGLSESQIEAMGRWHSKAYKKYIRIQTLTGI